MNASPGNTAALLSRIDEEQRAVADVVAAARWAGAQGWVPATSGNFSRRIAGSRIAITRSGADKASLDLRDVLAVDVAQPLPPGISAEGPLHVALYADPKCGAVLHTHSRNATLVSLQTRNSLELHGYELLKAFAGVTTHEDRVSLPVLPNSQDTFGLARQAAQALASAVHPVGYLIAGHGVYTWGATMADARRHLEALEFLFDLHLRRPAGAAA